MPSSKVKFFFRELATDFRWSQLFAIVCLFILSFLTIYSATQQLEESVPAKALDQLKWFGIGLLLYFAVALIDYHGICRKGWLVYLAVLGLLIWVLLYGRTIYGAKRWISFPGLTIQPSEFSKLTVLLTICYFLSRREGMLNNWGTILTALALLIVPTVLIVGQDLGTSIVVVVLGIVLMFIAGISARFFVYLGLFSLSVLALVAFDTYRYIEFRNLRATDSVHANTPFNSMLGLKSYQLNRIVGVVAPDELDPLDEGWNIRQSKIAIGSGKFYGKGWRKGDVTHGGYLPKTVSLNDFIFAVLAEENGFIGGGILICTYAVLLFGGLRTAMKAQDTLGMLLASGVTFLLFFHVLVNIGMTMGFFPIVGIPLPLMSYGGSFVVVCMICLGLVQSIWLHRKPY